MSNALQYKASKGFKCIYYICCLWWLLGGGGCFIIFGRFGKGSELIYLYWEGRYCVIFLLANFIFGTRPLLMIIAQFLMIFYDGYKNKAHILAYVFPENSRPVLTFPFGIYSLLFSLSFFLYFFHFLSSFFLSFSLLFQNTSFCFIP